MSGVFNRITLGFPFTPVSCPDFPDFLDLLLVRRGREPTDSSLWRLGSFPKGRGVLGVDDGVLVAGVEGVVAVGNGLGLTGEGVKITSSSPGLSSKGGENCAGEKRGLGPKNPTKKWRVSG